MVFAARLPAHRLGRGACGRWGGRCAGAGAAPRGGAGGQGSGASLVGYAVLPLTCPADGWLTLNAGARAQSDHTNAGCGAFPAVVASGPGAQVTGLAALESYNAQFRN